MAYIVICPTPVRHKEDNQAQEAPRLNTCEVSIVFDIYRHEDTNSNITAPCLRHSAHVVILLGVVIYRSSQLTQPTPDSG